MRLILYLYHQITHVPPPAQSSQARIDALSDFAHYMSPAAAAAIAAYLHEFDRLVSTPPTSEFDVPYPPTTVAPDGNMTPLVAVFYVCRSFRHSGSQAASYM